MASRPLSRHLADLCAERAAFDPDGLAVVSGGTELTNAHLSDCIERIAAGLSDLGVTRGGTVGLLCTNRWEWLATAIAATSLGARVAAFNTFVKAWDLGHMLRHSRAEVLVTLDRFRSADYLEILASLGVGQPDEGLAPMPDLRDVVVIGPEAGGARAFEDLLASRDRAPERSTSALDVGFLLYTSGSSARPKAVPLQHCAMIENGFEIGERMGLEPGDRVFVPVPLFWAYGASNALVATLTHGATLVLQEAFEPAEAIELIERHRCTAAYLLPNIARGLLAADGFERERVGTLRTGLTLGSPDEVRTIAETLGVAGICNIYGQTETYGNCCVTPTEWPLERRCESQGPPLPRVEIEIRGEDGARVEAGEVGEIHIRGYVMPGYVDAGEAADPIGADGFFASGDLGSVDAEGCLSFAARDNEMIKTGGINVAPREVEEFLATHPCVLEASVVGAEDERATEVVVAFVVARPGITAEELRDWCSERLAAYKVPARVHLVESLDRTETGKVSRRKLVERDRGRLNRQGGEKTS